MRINGIKLEPQLAWLFCPPGGNQNLSAFFISRWSGLESL